jgi:hypothetical protein
MTKYIDKVGQEDEGACTYEQSETSAFHYDSSVEVCGNERDDDCDCTVECDCDSCMNCDDCNEQVDYCDCISCRRCDECDEDEDDCECHLTLAHVESCKECLEISRDNESLLACNEHNMEAFLDSSTPRCMDIGNYHSNCDYECGCEINHECRGDGTDNRDGEMVSPPLDAKDLAQWTRDNYPQQTNTSCGSHQHTSFKRMKYYSIVMCKGFQEYMTKQLMEWAKATGIREGSAFYKRIDGQVHWCKNNYDAYQQISTSSKEDCRYRMINYCWQLHGTMEVRVLPAFQDVEYTISAHKELTRIIEQYIDDNNNSLQQRRKTITMEVMV